MGDSRFGRSMENKYFSYRIDDNGIWFLQFHSDVRAAVDEYIKTTKTLNAQIASGEIEALSPLPVFWDMTGDSIPSYHYMVFRARLSPPPKSLRYRIAYTFSSRVKMLEIQTYLDEYPGEQSVRKFYMADQRDEAIEWLLEPYE